jgi:hypothetical protein
VAEAQDVSRRYLDELFAKSGHRIETWMWEQRLQRAAEELSATDRSTDRCCRLHSMSASKAAAIFPAHSLNALACRREITAAIMSN